MGLYPAGPFLVVSTDGALHQEVLAAAAAGVQGAAAKFTGLYSSSWDTARAGDDFRRMADLLGRYDSWPHSESEAAVGRDLTGIIEAVGPGTFRPLQPG